MTDKATSESVKKIEEMMSQFMSHMDKRMSDMEKKVREITVVYSSRPFSQFPSHSPSV